MELSASFGTSLTLLEVVLEGEIGLDEVGQNKRGLQLSNCQVRSYPMAGVNVLSDYDSPQQISRLIDSCQE